VIFSFFFWFFFCFFVFLFFLFFCFCELSGRNKVYGFWSESPHFFFRFHCKRLLWKMLLKADEYLRTLSWCCVGRDCCLSYPNILPAIKRSTIFVHVLALQRLFGTVVHETAGGVAWSYFPTDWFPSTCSLSYVGAGQNERFALCLTRAILKWKTQALVSSLESQNHRITEW